MLFFGARVGDGGFFAAFGDGAHACVADAELFEEALGGASAAFSELDVVAAGAAFIAVSFDEEFFVLHLVDAVEVASEGLFGIGADEGSVEVEVDIFGVALVFDAVAIVTLEAGGAWFCGGASFFACGVAGAGAFADLLCAGAVGVAGTFGWSGDTLVAFADFAAIAITGCIAIVFADPFTGEGIGIASFATGAADIGAGFVGAGVAIAFLFGAAVLCGAALLACTVDAVELSFVGVVGFVGSAIFVAATFGPGGWTACEGDGAQQTKTTQNSKTAS